ncbi:MAG: hypothetical protein ABL986_24570 [Vicinamibacterales bacterium]
MRSVYGNGDESGRVIWSRVSPANVSAEPRCAASQYTAGQRRLQRLVGLL